MFKIMSTRQSFVPDADDDTLTDMNETYATANGDTTQYLSILESEAADATIFETAAFEDDKEFIHEEASMEGEEFPVPEEEEGNNGVVLYRVDNSEDLYGIQVIRDETGQLRRYQFKVKQGDDGILEALTDTIQDLPVEESEFEIRNVEDNFENQVFVKEEHNFEDSVEETLTSEKHMFSTDPNPFGLNAELFEGESQEMNEQTKVVEEEVLAELLQKNEDMDTIMDDEDDDGLDHDDDVEDDDDDDEEDGDGVYGEHVETFLNKMEIDEEEILIEPQFDNEELFLKTKKKNYYYLIRDPEKENLISFPSANPQQTVVRTNPRSILKVASEETLSSAEQPEDFHRCDKRFARSKEAQQARLFHNFIAQTKIIHAPVRRERLPRKQQIKPMRRTDEEIVVQEVVLRPTECIQLSDTEDEEEKENEEKRKKEEVVEILISDDDDDDDADDDEEEESETESEEIIILRVDNKCPKCPKSFPSEGGLRSHMQYHMYKDDNPESKYMCEKCGEQFKNNALLMRHSKAHLTKDHICILCKKVFPDKSALIVHRRSHIKQKMLETTIIEDKFSKINKNTPKKKFSTPKSAKKFHCSSCKSAFPSRLTFQHHLRTSCLKKRIKKDGSRTSKIVPPIQKELPGVRASASGMTKAIKCDSCSLTFPTYTSLFKHKVSKHALETQEEASLTKGRRGTLRSQNRK